MRFHIIRNACIENVGKSQSRMVSKLPIIWKQTVLLPLLLRRLSRSSSISGRRGEYPRYLEQGCFNAFKSYWNSSKHHALLLLLMVLLLGLRVRFQIIRNACIENVGKSQSCMVSKLRIIWKQTVHRCRALTWTQLENTGVRVGRRPSISLRRVACGNRRGQCKTYE